MNGFLIDIMLFEAPFRHCYFLKNEIWLRYVAISNSLNLMTFFGVFTILYKLNLYSLAYWICLFYIIKNNFKPNIFKPTSQDPGSASNYNLKASYGSAKNKKILILIYIQLVVVSLLMLAQLSFAIYTRISIAQQEEFQKDMYHTFCPDPQHNFEDEETYDEEGNLQPPIQASSSQNN